MNVNIRKLHPNAVIPQYGTAGAAAFDLVAVADVVIPPGQTAKIPLGLAFEIPVGWVMFVAMRSGVALNTKLRQPNGIGVIDSDYRGEVCMMFDNIARAESGTTPRVRRLNGKTEYYDGCNYDKFTYLIRAGDRVAQAWLMPLPTVGFTAVDQLTETVRGTGGFGHTGTTTIPAVTTP